jgi:hypothetical protein
MRDGHAWAVTGSYERLRCIGEGRYGYFVICAWERKRERVYIGGLAFFWSLLYFYQFTAKEMPVPSLETCPFCLA